MTEVCGNTAFVILDDIIQELCQFNLPCYDISEYAMRCAERGQFSKMIRGYKKAAEIRKMMSSMKDRDHIAHCFSSRVYHDQMIHSFVMRGVKSNQLNILVISSEEERAFNRVLGQNEIEFDPLVNSGKLVILRHEELYGSDLGSSFEPLMKQLQMAQVLAKARKMSGLNVIGTIAGNLALTGQLERCLQIERSWHETIRTFSMPITLLCPYQSDILAASTETQLVQYHNSGLKHN